MNWIGRLIKKLWNFTLDVLSDRLFIAALPVLFFLWVMYKTVAWHEWSDHALGVTTVITILWILISFSITVLTHKRN